MILPYCIAFMFFCQTARNYHYTCQRGEFRQDAWTCPLPLELSYIASTIGAFGLLIGGPIIGKWWWPLAAIGFTIIVGGFIQKLHDKIIKSLTRSTNGACISTLLGFSFAGIALFGDAWISDVNWSR